MLKDSENIEFFKVGAIRSHVNDNIPNIQFILKVHFKVISCSERSINIESSIRLIL